MFWYLSLLILCRYCTKTVSMLTVQLLDLMLQPTLTMEVHCVLFGYLAFKSLIFL